MTKEELKQREEELKAAGYCDMVTVASECDYLWYKKIRDPKDSEEWLYIVDWQVWNWYAYYDRDPFVGTKPCNMRLHITARTPAGRLAELECDDRLTIAEAESLAADFHKLINRYL